jgi:hypothetical protein
MRPRLVIPPALQFVVVALSGCGTPSPAPADATPADRADVIGDASGDVCVLPDAEPFGPQPGFACARAADAGASVQCPDRRVCARAECGAGCEACESTLFCIPDTLPDGGRPERCAQNTTCDLAGCGEGCRAVG